MTAPARSVFAEALAQAREALAIAWPEGDHAEPNVFTDALAALDLIEQRATDMETALREARFLLTPSCYRGTDAHNDQWRLDRARWQKQHGDPESAEAELADMNALRRMYAHEGKPNNAPLPDSALDEPVNDRAALSAREEAQT